MNKDYEYDVFISYAHKDNETLDDPTQGWVSRLHKALRIRLDQLLGEDVRVWRDPRLQGNDILDDELMDIVSKTATLVSILSPRYIASDWCTKEREQFIEANNNSENSTLENKQRIFKVIKTPVSENKEPEEVQRLLGYPFFIEEQESQRLREFYPDWGPHADKDAEKRIDDLAHDIKDLLINVQSTQETTKISTLGEIYLALTPSGMNEKRDQLQRELKSRGYKILPDQSLPLFATATELKEIVQLELEKCQLSVHLIGENFGFVPEDTEQSIAAIQLELAAEKSLTHVKFTQLIWMPADLKMTDKRQIDFVERITQLKLQPGDDSLQTPFHELLDVLKSKLNALQHNKKSATKNTDGPLSVYLIYHPKDEGEIQTLDDYFFEKGLEVKYPLFDGEKNEIDETHNNFLSQCDAVLIYWGQASEGWFQKQLGDLMQASAEERQNPLISKAVYLGGPEIPRKKRFRSQDVKVIKGIDGFDPSILSEFLAPMNQGSGDNDHE